MGRISLYFLVLYVVFNSAYGLFVAHRVTDTHESAWGILIGLVAKIGMPILAGYKLKVAARLNSRALRADAIEAIMRVISTLLSLSLLSLSIVLMVGLAATRILGWWWLDSVAALALIPFLIKKAVLPFKVRTPVARFDPAAPQISRSEIIKCVSAP